MRSGSFIVDPKIDRMVSSASRNFPLSRVHPPAASLGGCIAEVGELGLTEDSLE